MDINSAAEALRQRVDILDLIGSSVELRRNGRMHVGLCPFHSDTRPSLHVNPSRQTWKCWVCNNGGDLFSYVMLRDQVGFLEAVKSLAESHGVCTKSERKIEPPRLKDQLYGVLAWAEKQFNHALTTSSRAKTYLSDRGISDESIEKFSLGFSPMAWDWLLNQAKGTQYGPEILEAAGLTGRTAYQKHYDRFRGRITFPIRDPQGRTIAFGGRILPDSPNGGAKYINSPESLLFSKSDQLYALDIARDNRDLTIVEGYTDVIACHQRGINNVVAVLGTALNDRHVQLLRRYASSVCLLLDGDKAGQQRTNDIIDIFIQEQFPMTVATLPGGKDPDEYLKFHSNEDFHELVKQAVPAMWHKIKTVIRECKDQCGVASVVDALAEPLSKRGNRGRLNYLAETISSEYALDIGEVQSMLSRRCADYVI